MKTKLITSILFAIVTLATSPVVYGQSSVVSNVNNTLDQLKSAAEKAQSAYSNAEQAVKSVVPKVVSTVSNAVSNTNSVTVASTNSPSTPSTNGVIATVKTTINDAVIDILHGTKIASGEIYQASKTAITKAVDFTMEQAPIVVSEFLHWKMAEAIIYFTAWSMPAIILLCIARAFRKRSESVEVPKEDKYKTDQNDYAILKWVFRTIALMWITFSLTSYGMTVVKIAVVPRVYLIEYVVSTVHNGVPPSQ